MEDLSGLKGLQKALLQNNDSVFITVDGTNRVFTGNKKLDSNLISDLIEEENFIFSFIKGTDYILFNNDNKFYNEFGNLFLSETFDYDKEITSNLLIAHKDKIAPDLLDILIDSNDI